LEKEEIGDYFPEFFKLKGNASLILSAFGPEAIAVKRSL